MTTDEYLSAVTVGSREPLNSTVYLALYDAAWASKFSMMAARVHDALGESVLLLEHVGSTSVQGLSAKPIIDMVLAVSDPADESSYIPSLEKHGFTLRIREPDWFEHRLLKAYAEQVNLHVFSVECEEIDRMLVFRDWLRAHEEDRRKYEDVKKELASRSWKHVQNYADAKSEIVREILGRAQKSIGVRRSSL